MIYDARSFVNALANRVNNGGYENTKDYYKTSEIVFCDIENIHVVRDSFQRVMDMIKEPTDLQSKNKWLINFENTNWLQMISKILKGSNNIVNSLRVRSSNVLIHCSDGWDRTA